MSVTVARTRGSPSLHIDGLVVAAERESRVRVAVALANAEQTLDGPVRATCDAGGATVEGPAIDVAIALAVAAPESSQTVAAYAELSLTGELRPVRGVLAAVEALKGKADLILVAQENAAEAALVDGVRVFAVRTLADALRFIGGDERAAVLAMRARQALPSPQLDMRDVAGNAKARRALEIAAVGGHHMLLIGAPGTGKTMLARRLPGILPPLSGEEALGVTRVHSAAGLNVGGGLVTSRPFRAPHHSTTPPGLVGGGAAVVRPGEVSLAHNGVLFLDELPEFSRPALEVLAEPLRVGEVVLARSSGTLRFPARCQIVASTAPCPCGRFGDGRCSCSVDARRRYQGRVPERLLEAVDLRVKLEPVGTSPAAPAEASATIAKRVIDARSRRQAIDEQLVGDVLPLIERAGVCSRDAYARVVRVARSIAAFDGESCVRTRHFEEALVFAGASALS